MNDITEGHEVATMVADAGMVALLNKSEIDQQITTAHRFPRSIKAFRNEALQMVTLSEHVAQECFYALPRDGKVIEGPSARFAEVIASAWGNCRAGARVVSDQGEFVVAQGVFHDLEKNVAITYEVQRRIVNNKGKRYSTDMIGVTGNAASSVALRNAILKGVPKAFWSDLYTAARKCAVGDVKSLATKRASAIKEFVVYGITEEKILGRLGRQGVEDITIDDLVILMGLFNAIKDGDTTPEQAFAEEQATQAAIGEPQRKSAPRPVGGSSAAAEIGKTAGGTPHAGDQSTPPPANEPKDEEPSGNDEVTPENALKENQIRVIRAKLANAALTDLDFAAKWGAPLTNQDGFPNFRASQANAILEWISSKVG